MSALVWRRRGSRCSHAYVKGVSLCARMLEIAAPDVTPLTPAGEPFGWACALCRFRAAIHRKAMATRRLWMRALDARGSSYEVPS